MPTGESVNLQKERKRIRPNKCALTLSPSTSQLMTESSISDKSDLIPSCQRVNCLFYLFMLFKFCTIYTILFLSFVNSLKNAYCWVVVQKVTFFDDVSQSVICQFCFDSKLKSFFQICKICFSFVVTVVNILCLC